MLAPPRKRVGRVVPQLIAIASVGRICRSTLTAHYSGEQTKYPMALSKEQYEVFSVMFLHHCYSSHTAYTAIHNIA